MTSLLVGVVLAAVMAWVTGTVAARKGYPFWEWFGWGFLFWPVSFSWSLIMKANPATRRECPLCRTVIDARARVCPQCGRDVFEHLAAQPKGQQA